MALKLLEKSTAELVGTTVLKRRLGIPSSEHDSDLLKFELAALEYLGNRIERQILTATWGLFLDRFPPGGVIELRRCPVQAVESIEYLDAAGDEQTLAESAYRVDAMSEPGRIVRKSGTSWPATEDAPNAVKVTFTAGWETAADVPEVIHQAVYVLVGYWFDFGEEIGQMSPAVRRTVDGLLDGARWSL